MGIEFYTAVDHRIGSFSYYFPDGVKEQILEAIEAVDQCVPGVEWVMEASGLKIAYDPKNLHKVLPAVRGQKGSYYWPLHILYLGKSGIKHSIAHETAHILDFLSGPTPDQVKEKLGREITFLRSLYCLFPPNNDQPVLEAVESNYDPGKNFSGWFILKVIGSPRTVRNDKEIRRGIWAAIIDTRGSDDKLNSFVTERVAHLFEEYVYVSQLEQGAVPVGVPGLKYFANDEFWGKDWIASNQKDIQAYFAEQVQIIRERHETGALVQRLRAMWEQHHQQEEKSFWLD